MTKTGLPLPGMDAPIVRHADHTHSPQGSEGRHRIHVSRTGGGWEWAHLLYTMTGWEVTAAGSFPAADFPAHVDVAQEIDRRWRGESGDGFDRPPRDRYTVIGASTVAHLSREDDPARTYCGKPSGHPAEFDIKVKGHAEQRCIDCDQTYRAEHYGRVAVTY